MIINIALLKLYDNDDDDDLCKLITNILHDVPMVCKYLNDA